jgi:hypothetical protein
VTTATFTGIERNSGGAGWDWAASQFDTTPANADLNLTLNPLPIPGSLSSDLFQETEALSGWNLNDHLVGDSVVPSAVGGAGFSGCDALDQAGLDRIAGLAALVPTLINKVASSVPGIHCPLSGPIWGEGNILLGGAASDTIEGRGGNDIIDGDAALQVRISVRDHANHALEIGSSDLMEHQYLHTGAILLPSGVLDSSNLTGPTLQEAVFNGTIDPGDLVSTREIVHPVDPSAVDTAVFSGPQVNYTVSTIPAGAAPGSPGSVTTVQDNVGTDGTDTLRNIEVLQFGSAVVSTGTTTPVAPTAVTAVGGQAQATVGWVAPDVKHAGPQVVTGYQVEVRDAVTGALAGPLRPAGPAATSLKVADLAPGAYQFRVQAVNSAATPPEGAFSVSSPAVTVVPAVAPGAPTAVSASGGDTSAVVTWSAPVSDGGSAVTGYWVRVADAATDVQVGALRPAAAGATSLGVTGLVNGIAVRFQVQAGNGVGRGGFSGLSNSVSPATIPGVPVIGTPTRGNASALVRWAPSTSSGGSVMTGYSVRVVNAATNVQVGALRPAAVGATSVAVTGLVNGTAVRFQVRAGNAVGNSGYSALSVAVIPARVPARPVIAVASPGAVGGAVTAVARWAPPVSNGGLVVNGYVVTAMRINARGVVVARVSSVVQAAGARALAMSLPAGNYRFAVRARNGLGLGSYSFSSNLVTAR